MSAGIALAVRKDVRALLPTCDHEDAKENSRYISIVLKGETEIVFISIYGDVGYGHKRTQILR